MNSAVVEKLQDFFAKYPPQVLKPGDNIIQAGNEPSGIFFVEDGVIRQYWLSEQGSEITINIYKPHTFLPMAWAIGNVKNNHFYEAMTKALVRRAPKSDVLAFIRNDPDILYDLLRRIYVGIEGLWTHLEYLTTGSSYTKLIAALVILAKRFGKTNDKNEMVIDLDIKETGLANYAGMTRETANRELQKLRKENFIHIDKGLITIPNLENLESLLFR